MFDELTTTPSTAFQVVVATVVIYLGFLRWSGCRAADPDHPLGPRPRLRDGLGALIGRTALLAVPSLATGLVAPGDPAADARGSCRCSAPQQSWSAGGCARPSRSLVHRGRLPRHLRRARVSDDELRQQLRLAGVTTLAQVAHAVLERNRRDQRPARIGRSPAGWSRTSPRRVPCSGSEEP